MDKKVAVLVTTQHRGVFFGYADKDTLRDAHITLSNARNCIYWTAAVGGFLGLAKTGPGEGCRIGAQVDEFIARDVTSVAICTEKAAASWMAFK